MPKDIDLFKYGVKDTWEKLMGEAYEGEIPDGGYDFPSAAILSKAESHWSDMHVDMKGYESIDWSEYTMDSSLAVLNTVPEAGPKTTDNPFEFPSDVADYPGMFGGALKNYCEARALLINGKSDVTGLDEWFRCSWGVPDDFDLDYVTPNMRSTGPAMWGGISRVLKPLNTMLPASVPGLEITHHGKHRTDYGDTKLVDWARINAVAESITVQLYADDTVARGQVKRMDFSVVQANLPDAPSAEGQRWDFPKTTHPKFESGAYKNMMESIRKAKAKEDKVEMDHHKDGIFVNVTGKIDRIKMAELRNKNVTIDTNFGKDWYLGGVDVDIPEPAKKPRGFISQHLGRYKTQDLLLVSRVKQIINTLPRHAQILKDVGDTEILGGTAPGFARNKVVIKQVFGPRFLHLTRDLGDYHGGDKGWDWVVQTAKEAGITDGTFMNPSLAAIYHTMTNSVKGVNHLAARAARIIRDVDQWQASNFTMVVGGIGCETGSMRLVIGNILSKKKRYWVNRCIRNYKGRLLAKDSQDHMVVSQIRAKTLRATKFVVDDEGGISVDMLSHDTAFRETVDNFVRKRSKMVLADAATTMPLMALTKMVDDIYKIPPLLKFVRMYQHSIDYLEEFRRDAARSVLVALSAGQTNGLVTDETADFEAEYDDPADLTGDGVIGATQEQVVKQEVSSLILPARYETFIHANFQQLMEDRERLLKHEKHVKQDTNAALAAALAEVARLQRMLGSTQAPPPDVAITQVVEDDNPEEDAHDNEVVLASEMEDEELPGFLLDDDENMDPDDDETGGFVLSDDDEDGDDEVDEAANLVSVRHELEEDLPMLQREDLDSVVAITGRFATLEEYEKILATARLQYAYRLRGGGQNAEIGDDIIDVTRM